MFHSKISESLNMLYQSLVPKILKSWWFQADNGKVVWEAHGLDPYKIYQMLIYVNAHYVQKNTIFLEQVVLG